jgi:hypothetical protein
MTALKDEVARVVLSSVHYDEAGIVVAVAKRW